MSYRGLSYAGVPIVDRVIKIKYEGLDALDRQLPFGFGRGKPVPDNVAILMSPEDCKKFDNDLVPIKKENTDGPAKKGR